MEPGSFDRYLNVTMVYKTYEPETGVVFKGLKQHTCTDDDINEHF